MSYIYIYIFFAMLFICAIVRGAWGRQLQGSRPALRVTGPQRDGHCRQRRGGSNACNDCNDGCTACNKNATSFSQPRTTPHAPCDILYTKSHDLWVLTGACDPIRWCARSIAVSVCCVCMCAVYVRCVCVLVPCFFRRPATPGTPTPARP